MKAREITIPSLGVAMEDALVVAWLKQEGEDVDADEPVVEIETDKSTMELVAPAAGRLGPQLHPVGAVVPVGGVLAAIYDSTAELPVAPAAPAATETSAPPSAEADLSDERPSPAETGRGPHRMSPRARREALLQEAATPGRPGEPARENRFRALIAERVSEAWRSIPHFTVARDIDVQELGAELCRLKADGRRLTVTDALLRAQALALAAEPSAGPRPDIGLAVASDLGVVIPVIRDVLGRSLSDLSAARRAAVERARDGKLSADDLELPPSTLSNLGTFAIDSFTGIVAPGQTTLVTTGRIRRVAAVVGDQVVPRDMLVATINADHRVLDGADAARILAAFAFQLEDPSRIFGEEPLVV